MPNNSISISIISSSQATLEEAIKHDIVNDLDVVVDTVNDWPGIHVKANECAGITRRSCNDEVCAGGPVFYVYNVDAAAATCATCTGHELDKRFTTAVTADTQESPHVKSRRKPAGKADDLTSKRQPNPTIES